MGWKKVNESFYWEPDGSAVTPLNSFYTPPTAPLARADWPFEKPVTWTVTAPPLPAKIVELPWECPKCEAQQLPSEVKTTEITEPGVGSRVEYFGKIRPSYVNDLADGSYIEYECLVCGHVWDNFHDDDDPDPSEPDDINPHNIIWLQNRPRQQDHVLGILERDAC
jgi:rubredoxin